MYIYSVFCFVHFAGLVHGLSLILKRHGHGAHSCEKPTPTRELATISTAVSSPGITQAFGGSSIHTSAYSDVRSRPEWLLFKPSARERDPGPAESLKTGLSIFRRSIICSTPANGSIALINTAWAISTGPVTILKR